MRAMQPWTGMTNFKQELDRFFGPFGELKLDEFPALGDWAPSMDVSETKEALVIKAEVPGLDPTDIWHWLRERPVSECGRLRQGAGGHRRGAHRRSAHRRSVLMLPTLTQPNGPSRVRCRRSRGAAGPGGMPAAPAEVASIVCHYSDRLLV